MEWAILSPDNKSGVFSTPGDSGTIIADVAGAVHTPHVVESAAFVRSTDPVFFPPSEYTEEIEDTTSSASAPDIELFSSPFAWKKDYSTLFGLPKGEMGTVAAVLLRWV
ncbi:hypothetical protein M0805_005561 [Coniferiporia weirii]|nr:hypothetical protein M0805_005561 [Coniferiporia weirii]